MTGTQVAVMAPEEHVDTPSASARERLAVVPDTQEPDEVELARQLVAQTRAAGLDLTGPKGLLKAITKTVLETALEEEMAEHLGYDKHDRAGHGTGNSRNGSRTKTVLTDACGQVPIDVPRDREGTFEPVIVKKRQRRLGDVNEVILSLSARGLTTGKIQAHFADIYGTQVSKDTISRITSKMMEEMTTWQTRPWNRYTRPCSLTRSTSRSVMGKSVPAQCTQRSAWTWPDARTSWACGLVMAMGS